MLKLLSICSNFAYIVTGFELIAQIVVHMLKFCTYSESVLSIWTEI